MSVGHRSSLLRYHSHLLTVQPPPSAVMPDWSEGRTADELQGDTNQTGNSSLLTWRLERINNEVPVL